MDTYQNLRTKKTYNFSLTKKREARKKQMAEPVEMIIIQAQQSFEIAGGLNQVQIRIEDDKVLNIIKRYKNVRYKLTPLGLLFPVENDTEQIFLTFRELNDVKKSLINSKSYRLFGISDLKKINNWEEINQQSLQIKATLEEEK